MDALEFERDDIRHAAETLGLASVKNLGDLVYSFKYRRELPEAIRLTAPNGKEWRVTTAGRSRYRLVLAPAFRVNPDPLLAQTKVPEATPGIIARYAFNDEQALLAKLRYNRLIDIFTGVTCYSLQNHLRTSVRVESLSGRIETMQIETDEVYVGVDRRGAHYVIPVQAKGGRDKIAVQQVEQDILLCREKFPALICMPIAAQFMDDDVIALFVFEESEEGVRKRFERHYRLVQRDGLTDAEIKKYSERIESSDTL